MLFKLIYVFFEFDKHIKDQNNFCTKILFNIYLYDVKDTKLWKT